MTRVNFYSNLQDKKTAMLGLVQTLLAKKHQITILVDDEKMADDCSKLLWHNDQTTYLMNVLATSALAEQTPVLLAWQDKPMHQDDVLINLTQNQLTVFSRFKQLIELVSEHEQDKVLARERFAFYRDRGYEVRHFDQGALAH